mmetsp:Transcript_10587/g.29162  ORF Transcript_10587/g.29162 Transcript_10587/m.29162 type:complete len:298 (-) Transcript_10587:978-1871(-)
MRFIVSCLPRRRGECSNLPSPIPHHLFKRPLVLPPHLGLLFGCEVVLDVERCPDLLGTLALDHVRNRQAHEVEEVLDVQVVCRENQLEKPSLIPNRRKLLVPLLQLGLLLRRQFGLLSHPRLFHSVGVLLAPVHRQLQDVPPHVGERKPVRVLLVLDHVRHCLRQQRHRFLDLDFLPIGRHQCNLQRGGTRPRENASRDRVRGRWPRPRRGAVPRATRWNQRIPHVTISVKQQHHVTKNQADDRRPRPGHVVVSKSGISSSLSEPRNLATSQPPPAESQPIVLMARVRTFSSKLILT